MDTAQLNFKVIDQSFSQDDGIKGITGYMGIFKRGPVGKTDEIYSSWSQFKKVYGGLISTSDDPLIVKRLIERGSKVRICGIRHFADISDANSITAAKGTPIAVKNLGSLVGAVAPFSGTITVPAFVAAIVGTALLTTPGSTLVDGNTVYVYKIENGIYYGIAQYTKITGDSTLAQIATAVAAAVTASTSTNGGYTGTAVSNDVRINAPTGAAANGIQFAIYRSNDGYLSTPVPITGGVDPIPNTLDIIKVYVGPPIQDNLIGLYTKVPSDSTPTLVATGIKNAINGNTVNTGFTASGTAANYIVTGTTAMGAAKNGVPINVFQTTVGNTTPTTLGGGTTGAPSTDTLFSLIPKYPGVNNNSIRVTVSKGSNGQANYFDLKIDFSDDPDYTPEVYKNLIIPGRPTAVNSSYLGDVVSGSNLVDVLYADLNGYTGIMVPINLVTNFVNASNGASVVDSDYIGDSNAKNGLHAFDSIGDIYAIGCNNSSNNMAIGGAAYAASRKDIQYFHHFDNAYVNPTQIANLKASLNIDTPYVQFWAGGLLVLDPLSNLPKKISAIGDILGASAYSEIKEGAYRSFAGTNRGLIFNALGVVNNFGSVSDLTSLNTLSNRQINAVVNVDGQIYLSGNFSAQLATSHLSFNNVVRLILYIQRSLRPLVKVFIEEPNDIPTWKQIFLTVTPFLDSLVNPKRAVYDYKWQGDQDVTDISQIQINNSNDIGLGKYKALLWIKDIVSLQQFEISIIITESSVSFENLNITNQQ